MELVKAILATEEQLPPITALGYEYIVAANGLFVRAEDSRIEALLPVSHPISAKLHGLHMLTPHIKLKVPRVPVKWLYSIHQSAVRQIDREVLYQFRSARSVEGLCAMPSQIEWSCIVPSQIASATDIDFLDQVESVIDLHSHNTMNAFFSGTDDGDDEESEEILPRTVHCECGQATGERCAWVGDPIETVMVEWMPESLRESHVAAGNRGTYPHNGSLHLRMEASCAATIVEWDPEWTAIVESQMIDALHGVDGIRILVRDVER